MGSALLAARWYSVTHSLRWQARRGLQLLETADTPKRIHAALEQWESETAGNWRPRRDEFIKHLYTNYPVGDQRIRLLLAWVSDADCGPRQEDWQRWHKDILGFGRGSQPSLPKKDGVSLHYVWDAPVGLTGWFTTIIPLGGQIYVASLGTEFDDPADSADGVVRVDGRSGSAELFFTPPATYRGPRDVVGLAVCDNGLLVACANGALFQVGLEGQIVWQVHVGDPIIGPPLACDVNRDGVTDAIVPTRASKSASGKAVAFSGSSGKTLWSATVARSAPGETSLGATLALGDVLPAAGSELVVTMPTGEVCVLALRTGEILWQHELAAGTIAGAVCRPAQTDVAPPAYLGDRGACVWWLASADRKLAAVAWQVPALRAEETLIAGLRPLSAEGGKAALLIACPSGNYRAGRGAVCALGAEGIRWRTPVGGAIWGTPAVADLNGDGSPELVVASVDPRPAGELGGAVTILSAAGRYLRRATVPAAIEAAPVVADVDGDQRLEVLVADQSGRLHCYRTEGFGPVEWGLANGDSHNTRNATNAYAYGQTLFAQQWQWRPETK